MKKYNHGTTIIEVLVSIILISVVIGLLFGLLSQIQEDDEENNLNASFILAQSNMVKAVEEDAINYTIKRVSPCTLTEAGIKSDTIASNKYECLRIPHFYRSFYVYKYATSLCIAYRFASDIINKKENAVENYIKFISSGGKAYPLDILKECGIDLEKEDLMSYSIKLIEKYMDELEKLI